MPIFQTKGYFDKNDKNEVRSTASCKTHLANYKFNRKKLLRTCQLVHHFIADCPDESLSNLKFMSVNLVNIADLLIKIAVKYDLHVKHK